MSSFLNENHWGSVTLTLLNVLGVLGVLNVLNVLNVLDMPMDASLACWAMLLNTHPFAAPFSLLPPAFLNHSSLLTPCTALLLISTHAPPFKLALSFFF